MIYKLDNPERFARWCPQFVDYIEDKLINNMCGQSLRLPAVVYDQLEVFNNDKYVYISSNCGKESDRRN